MSGEKSRVDVPFRPFDPGAPWSVEGTSREIRLADAVTGRDSRLQTRIRLFHDRDRMGVLFVAEDDEALVATYRNRDDPLWEEDVVEVFLAPEDATRYFEFEINPMGTLFDARIRSPRGERSSMKVDRDWDCEGFVAFIRKSAQDRRALLEILALIPFSGMGRHAPVDGEEWLANFFRIDRGRTAADEFSAWRPTLRNPPDFHVPAAFGAIRFRL